MVTPSLLRNLYGQIEKVWRDNGFIAGKSGRHMKFPYTLSAKIAQFPVFFYMKNNWIWMYWPVGASVSLYVFAKIHALANSEANVKSWQQTQLKNAEKEAHGH
ncbi:unnamed protein product [Arctia plantaginis]|uniref:Uncharacterized protein n=1 Tax=Arctia plantaginis TaxID=874455 RepID=A0A8S1AB69_ARCPL|nr:unnamed protein product [Arctia plantaginis]